MTDVVSQLPSATIPDMYEPNLLENQDAPYIPSFWENETSAVDPSLFTIDCSQYDVSALKTNDQLKAKMIEVFDRIGLVVLTNTGLTDLSEMRDIALNVIEKPMEYKGGANARDGLTVNVYETGAPKEGWLHYHHEMAYVSKSTSMLAFLCEHSVPNKGWSFVSDQVAMTKHILQTELGQKLKDKGLCYIRCLTDREAYAGGSEEAVYNHWQKSFGVETMEEAQAMAEERGLKVEWGADPNNSKVGNRYMITKFYVSAYEYCPATDSNLMYASVADDAMWFDGWPGMKDLPASHRPLKLTYGDDEEFAPAEFRQWVDIYDKFGVPIKWEQGDISIVCNWRWAHGRPAFTLEGDERRQLGVVLGATFDRIEHLDNKWPKI